MFSGIGVLGVSAFIEWLRRRSRSSEHAAGIDAKGAKVANSPVASGSGITQNIGDTHHHYPPRAHPVQGGVPRPLPNIVYAGPKEKLVFISNVAQDGIRKPRTLEEENKSVPAFILKFENRTLPDRSIGRAPNVIAKMRFKSEDRATERRIDYGVWLDSPGVSTTFGIGDTCELVLMTVINKEVLTFEDQRTEGHKFYSGYTYLDFVAVDGLPLVEVTLIDQQSQVTVKRSFKVWREGPNFCLTEIDSLPDKS